MADRLNGYRILILETREEAQFSRLLGEQGADVLQCPMFTIHDAPEPAPIEAWIRRFVDAPFDDLVLTTGEGLRRLMKVVRRIGLEQEFIAALGQARKLEAASGSPPLFLIDDIFGELDPVRRNSLLAALPGSAQKFVTATTLHWLESTEGAVTYILNDGRIEKKS